MAGTVNKATYSQSHKQLVDQSNPQRAPIASRLGDLKAKVTKLATRQLFTAR